MLKITYKPDMAIATANRVKTKTRRVITPQPHSRITRLYPIQTPDFAAETGEWACEYLNRSRPWTKPSDNIKCPYGKPGDKFCAASTWAAPKAYDIFKPSAIPDEANIWSYFHSPEPPAGIGKMRPARFLPTHLYHHFPIGEITDIRVERIQEITNEDAIAEGMTQRGNWWDAGVDWQGDGAALTPYGAFAATWERINGQRSPWHRNDWVWVISYQLLTPNS